MAWLLDTNTCIGHLRSSTPRVTRRLASVDPHDVVLCSVVRAELVYGALRSENPHDNLDRVKRFVSGFRSLPFDDRAAESYGEIRAELAAQGTPIGPNDLMIAAIAKANGLTLVTHNTSEFGRVRGLKTEDWES